MKKRVLIIAIFLQILSTATTIEKADLSSYKKQKELGARLWDFNNIGESFSVGYDKNYSITNHLKWGPLYYNFSYSKEFLNSIGLSQNLRDFLINKYDVSMNQYYNKNEEALREYEYILKTYADFVLKSKEYEYTSDTLEKLKLDRNIIETQYSSGIISEIDYETTMLSIEEFENNLNLINSAKKDLEKELLSYGYIAFEIEEFNVSELNSEKVRNYVKYTNEKNRINNKLIQDKKIYEKFPDVVIGAQYDIENKNFSVNLNISKNFTISGEDDNFETTKKFIDLNEEDIYSKYEVLLKNSEFSTKKVELLEKNLKINELKYKLGKISYKELLDARIKLNEAKLKKISANNDLTIFVLVKGAI